LPQRGSPTVRGRRLAAELRRLRERSGLTGEEAADRLGWSGSKISRIELHRIGVKQADLRKLLDLYRVESSHQEQLIALAHESSQKDWLIELATANFAPEYAAYLHAEAEAESVWTWEPQVVPGLLQTPEYGRAVMSVWHRMFPGPPQEADRRIEARLLRQQLLTKDPPLEFSAVIDESVLLRRFGDSQVMAKQLQKILDTSELPNVHVRVFRLDGDSPLATGSFSYMKFPQIHQVPLNDLVSLEHLEGNFYLEDVDDTYRYKIAFEYVASRALGTQQSRALITKIARHTWA
jgi:transcriptional regulator with XRE-family HTH domain